MKSEVQSALTWLKRHSSKATRDGMGRYGLPSDKAFGVTMANMKVLAKRLGRNHELAAALWDTGCSHRLSTSLHWSRPRTIGKRNRALNDAAVTVARRLADSPQPEPRWVGKDALRELTSPAVVRRLAPRK